MEIRDILYGSIQIEPWERAVVDSPFFQRLRFIRQLGFAEYAYPSATHNRFIHSLGAMHVAGLLAERLFSDVPDYPKLRAMVRLAALLHDVGHGPLSHTSESAMGLAHELLPNEIPSSRQATHEDYTLAILKNSEMTARIDEAGRSFGFGAYEISGLIDPKADPAVSQAFLFPYKGTSIQFFPILRQMVSGELDVDRMDYLQRDSFFAGVNYGKFDFEWLSENLIPFYSNGSCYLAIQQRALYAFEDFLLSRYHMFLMVYYHHKSIAYDSMLKRFLEERPAHYTIPTNLDSYLHCTDPAVFEVLRNSKNIWAQKISNREPYTLFFEQHSHHRSDEKIGKLIHYLEEKNISHFPTESLTDFSKYRNKSTTELLYVRYDNRVEEPVFEPLHKSASVFSRYETPQKIERIYVDSSQLTAKQWADLKVGARHIL